MLETLVYLLAAVGTVLLLTWLTPPEIPLRQAVLLVGALFLALATARHGPAAIASVLDAAARLLQSWK